MTNEEETSESDSPIFALSINDPTCSFAFGDLYLNDFPEWYDVE